MVFKPGGIVPDRVALRIHSGRPPVIGAGYEVNRLPGGRKRLPVDVEPHGTKLLVIGVEGRNPSARVILRVLGRQVAPVTRS